LRRKIRPLEHRNCKDGDHVTVGVGTAVIFDLGDPGEGRFVATSADPGMFRVTDEGRNEGSYTINAGGIAQAPGTTEVTVQFLGPTNGRGTSTTFTITVA
jgi:hypothetical protein